MSCRLLLRCGIGNDLPALFGWNPFSALFAEFLRHVELDHNYHCCYQSQPNSQRMGSQRLALLEDRLYGAHHRINIATPYTASRDASAGILLAASIATL